MCDMQKMPTRDEASCDEDSDMNFAAFSSAGTHFVTTNSQLPVAKIQQNVSNNGSLSQVVGMVGGIGDSVQYVRHIDGGATLQATQQLISVPISLPGSKPGDPQPTVQIQVLGPNLHALQSQQQPKYQMQIPIQGFQQGGAVLTLAYNPDGNENGGLQFLGNSSLPEGLQVLAMPQEMQLAQHQQETKEHVPQNIHQVFITPNHQILISGPDGNKVINNNTSTDNNNPEIIIKEELDICVEDESSQGTEESEGIPWQLDNPSPDLVKYLNTLPPQQTQQLPASLQQFLRLNPAEIKKDESMDETNAMEEDGRDNMAEAIGNDDVTITKKKKKYKKKPPKPARPKPGQVVIATAADGTPIYCCPECQMAFPEKGELEVHLIVHKIERRFICGICGAGLKRKEHLERHKLGHNPERPYVCGACGKGFKRREHLNLHTVIHSGVKTELCGECGKGFYRKDHLRKHMRSHVTRRARDDANGDNSANNDAVTVTNINSVLPEITIHVPTNSNMQVPVHINIPQHVMSSLAAANAQAGAAQAAAAAAARADAGSEAHATLDALLAQHS